VYKPLKFLVRQPGAAHGLDLLKFPLAAASSRVPLCSPWGSTDVTHLCFWKSVQIRPREFGRVRLVSSKQRFTILFDRGNLMQRQVDRPVLEMALVGYEAERRKISDQIAAIQKQLGH